MGGSTLATLAANRNSPKKNTAPHSAVFVRSFIHSFIHLFCDFACCVSREFRSAAVSRCPTKFLCVDAGIATAVGADTYLVHNKSIECKIPEIYLCPHASFS
jgi:hypothetical protein